MHLQPRRPRGATFPGVVSALFAVVLGSSPLSVSAQTNPSGTTVAGVALDSSGTAGANGSNLIYQNQGTVTAGPNVNQPTVSLTSNGGAASSLNAGGQGGSVTFVNAGTIASVQPGAPAVISLQAIGGTGGASTSGIQTPGAGGAGGSITLLNTTNQPALNAPVYFSAHADGGISGASANARSAPGGTGGVGGLANFNLQSGALTFSAAGTTSTPAYGVSLSANGGAGAQGLNALTGFFDFANYASIGGIGGAGGQSILTLGGSVTLSGSNAVGLLLSANGGAGGVGGSDTSTLNQAPGNGGAGGAAGTVNFTVGTSGQLSVPGNNAIGIMLSANGGNGGTGGYDTGGVVITTGAQGGTGANVGDSATKPAVTFTNSGQISVTGSSSAAVVLQSAGGAGGNGSPVGGSKGGDAGNGGYITASNYGQITTAGAYDFGIFAQSVGGTGGTGGPGYGTQLGGGNGGNSGLAGGVIIQNSGTISTVGDGASAVVAQSIGGGNASAAFVATTLNLNYQNASQGANGGQATGFIAARGGLGGSGGDGGPVSFSNSGSISTNGAEAFGLFGQSVGGGGGNGGGANNWGVGISIALGGSGGGGGDGGDLTLVGSPTPGSIASAGLSSPAINLQSVGGSGGVGGGVDATAYGVPAGIAIAIGGSGGLGGDGGDITLTNTSVLTTRSIDSPGILASSTGGGGGQAGQASSTAFSLSINTLPSVAWSTAVGGTGGTGGDGGDITITNQQSITTLDAQSHAIEALSTGKGGGNGANALATALALGTSTSIGALSSKIALGGAGGGSGDGGDITITNSSSLSTAGLMADGIRAVSTGAGGGDAGTGSATTVGGLTATILALAISPTTTFNASIAVGGGSGAGGDGGNVSVSSSGSIQTTGGSARGIFAQSTGKGGGTATGGNVSGSAKTSIEVAIGGAGGGGGDGGNVTVNNFAGATIKTSGGDAHAMFAQSQGGGGGQGGTMTAEVYSESVLPQGGIIDGFKTAVLNAGKNLLGRSNPTQSGQTSPFSVGASVSVGGDGGTNGSGGQITMSNVGHLLTAGNLSHGIFGQSTGGGGGAGGAASTAAGKLFSAALGVGGLGGAQGDGGSVTLSNAVSSTIVTGGQGSFGMFGQSVGGGGGVGGAASDDTNYTYALTLSLGGSGGASGDGGDVIMGNVSLIQTTGVESHGMVAQSAGGGGGVTFLNLAAQDTPNGGGTNNTGSSPTLSFNIGGAGGAGGNGGELLLEEGGTIQTSGRGAIGILGQSAGGGGGFGVQGATSRDFSTSGSIGGAGGAAGNGGTINLSFITGYNGAQPSITTTGNGAAAVLLESIGGGGGYSGSLNSTANFAYGSFLPANGGAAGNGGAIVVASSPGTSLTLATTGAGAHGLYLQSLGGGGGAIGSGSGLLIPLPSNGIARAGATGTGGPITVNTVGAISVMGSNSVGIYAQSGVQLTDGTVAAGTGGNITIQHNGSITGGSGTGAAIQIDGGANNVISLSGAGPINARSGNVILASNGNDTVTSSSWLIGNINLGSGTNQLTNASGGTLRAGNSLNLGGGNFTNSGTLAIFDDGPGATTVNGSFTQTATGQWQVYVDYSKNQADLLTVTGPANLSGTIVPIIYGLPATVSPQGLPALPLLTASQITTSNLTFINSLAFTYSLSSGTTANLQVAVNFAPPAVLNDANITPSLQDAAKGLQATWTAGNLGTLQPEFFALAQINSVATYESTLANYATEGAAAQASGVAGTATALQSSLHSFPAFAGDSTRLTEEGGGYVRVTSTTTRFARGDWNTGYDQTAHTTQAGGQRAFANGWFGGAALGYTTLAFDADDRRFTSHGHRYDLGVVVKKLLADRWLLAASLGYGYGDSDGVRVVERQGQREALSSAVKFHSLAGRVRGAWQFAGRGWYLRPSADLDVTGVASPAHTERGDIRYAMRFDSNQDWTVALTPAVEAGLRLDLGQTVARPYVSVGENLAVDRSWSRGARLAGTAVAGSRFASRYDLDESLTQVAVGLDVIARGRLELKAEYRGSFGSGYETNAVAGRLAYRF